MYGLARGGDDQRMNTPNALDVSASVLLDTARDFQSVAEQPGSHIAASDALVSLEEALQVLSAAWYELAADAVPRVVARGASRSPHDGRPATSSGLSREAEVGLVGTLHDVAAGFARRARVCREGRSTATPIIARAGGCSASRMTRRLPRDGY